MTKSPRSKKHLGGLSVLIQDWGWAVLTVSLTFAFLSFLFVHSQWKESNVTYQPAPQFLTLSLPESWGEPFAQQQLDQMKKNPFAVPFLSPYHSHNRQKKPLRECRQLLLDQPVKMTGMLKKEQEFPEYIAYYFWDHEVADTGDKLMIFINRRYAEENNVISQLRDLDNGKSMFGNLTLQAKLPESSKYCEVDYIFQNWEPLLFPRDEIFAMEEEVQKKR